MRKVLASILIASATAGATGIIVQESHATLAPELGVAAWVQTLTENQHP